MQTVLYFALIWTLMWVGFEIGVLAGMQPTAEMLNAKVTHEFDPWWKYLGKAGRRLILWPLCAGLWISQNRVQQRALETRKPTEPNP